MSKNIRHHVGIKYLCLFSNVQKVTKFFILSRPLIYMYWFPLSILLEQDHTTQIKNLRKQCV